MEIQIGMHCKLFMDDAEYIIEDLEKKEFRLLTQGGEEIIRSDWYLRLRDSKNANIIRKGVSIIHITETY
jgi:hypothetical protein